jgi:hypothetical protein
VAKGGVVKNEKDLDTLETEIDTLETAMIEAQRRAGDLVGDELAFALADAEAACARLRLDSYYRIYFRTARAARSTQCRVHGEAILVSCPECAERNPYVRKAHDEYIADVRAGEVREALEESGAKLVIDLQATAAAVEEGKRLDIEPAKTLRILHAARRTA